MKNYFHLCLLAAMVIPFILLVKYAYSSDFQAQGRYLMPMLIPFMYFITLGYHNVMNRFIKSQKAKSVISNVFCIGYIVSAIGVYLFVFMPNYM